MQGLERWLLREAGRAKAAGVSEENVRKLLLRILRHVRDTSASVHELTYALNDALLKANIALKDAPWFNVGGAWSGGGRVNYLEVEIVGFQRPISASI